jgi:hypothetical protein
MTFSQFLIIWSGNLPEETPYYLARARGGWPAVAGVLALFHFALPMLLLLIRFNKVRPGVLRVVAAWILLMRFVDLAWAVLPARTPEGAAPGWALWVVPPALVAVFLWSFLGRLAGRPLVPLHDPRFEPEPIPPTQTREANA